jgi:chromosomal replication initiator protein
MDTLGKQDVIHRDTDIVSAFRTMLCDRLGPDRFDLWFSDASITIADNTIFIAVSTAFGVEQIRKTFYKDVVEVGEQLTEQKPRVELHVAAPTSESPQASIEKTESVNNADTAESPDELPLVPASQHRNARVLPLHSKPSNVGRRFSSLSTFVAGDCNKLATCSVDIILNDLGQISPFFVHGPSGCGKTHLLEGIWSKVRNAYPRKRAVYLSAEQFTTYFLQALKGGGLPSFRRKYRGVDLLIVDDIQFFSGKQATIVELLHTIDANLREGGQLILAADRNPAQLRSLGQELLARLSSGLACEMKPLDGQTRRQLLKQMAKDRDLDVSDAVLNDIAESAPGDGRQLSGLLNRLWVSSRAFEKPVCQTMAREVVRELFPTGRSIVRLNDIEKAICEEFSIEPETLKSDRRSRDVSHPRMLAMWLARKHTRAGLSEISEYFGRKSHSTVLSAKSKVDSWISQSHGTPIADQSDSVKEIVSRIERRLRTG